MKLGAIGAQLMPGHVPTIGLLYSDRFPMQKTKTLRLPNRVKVTVGSIGLSQKITIPQILEILAKALHQSLGLWTCHNCQKKIGELGKLRVL